jgi:hypothetical protein
MDRKSMVDAKYGPGSYEKAIQRIKPSKCHRYLDDVLHGFKLLDVKPVFAFFECVFSDTPPERIYPESESFSNIDQFK